jgi:hypothetical protein
MGNSNLQPLQFAHAETKGSHTLDAYHAGEHVGRLSWHKQSSYDLYDRMAEPAGSIDLVITDPAHRREGVASALLGEGRKYTPRPRHSGTRTDAGDAWASATSKRPKKNRDHVHVPDSDWDRVRQPSREFQGFLF